MGGMSYTSLFARPHCRLEISSLLESNGLTGLSNRPQPPNNELSSITPETVTAEADVAEIFAAVQSLYMDELRPYGRLLRKRLGERAAIARQGLVGIDMKRVRALCQSCPCFRFQIEDGGDWSALIYNCSDVFVDVYSPRDVYPLEVWHALAAYIENIDNAAMFLPGGRYLCAKALVERRLPFFEGYSLGQVCHVVQLAISQKKLLGYLNGVIVPYRFSQSMEKELCAENQRPCLKSTKSRVNVANWQTVRTCLKHILDDAVQGSIPLSNVKRLFRSRFHVVLSETALGHTKLSEMLQDPYLQDLCTLQLQTTGYVLVPNVQPAVRTPISLAANLPLDCTGNSADRAVLPQPLRLENHLGPNPPTISSPTHGIRKSISPLMLQEDASDVNIIIRNTFIDIALPPLSPIASSRKRARSVPPDFGSNMSKAEATCNKLSFLRRSDSSGAAMNCSTDVATASSLGGDAPFILPAGVAIGKQTQGWVGVGPQGQQIKSHTPRCHHLQTFKCMNENSEQQRDVPFFPFGPSRPVETRGAESAASSVSSNPMHLVLIASGMSIGA